MGIPTNKESQHWVAAYGDHRRTWRDHCYVYPTISRRSRGVSIGINLTPNKVCNFDCVYCESDRRIAARAMLIDFGILESELREMIRTHQSGELFTAEPFASLPSRLRRLNDIAFSGDGEPTTCAAFARAVELAASIKRELADETVKLILITNASRLDRPAVKRGLALLDANQGEIWAKLDAGTPLYQAKVNRTAVGLDLILANIESVGRERPIRIQTLFLRMRDEAPSPAELTAYCDRLRRLSSHGCQIAEVQIYTVARPPAESWVAPLSRAELEEIGCRVRETTGLRVECYAGVE